jgi:hypothetical protein
MPLTAIALAAALAAAPASQSATKQIQLRDETSAPGVTLTVRQTKSTYHVNEPIRLRAKVDKTAFVYVYTRDADSKYLTLLYPARAEDNNRLTPNKWTILPPRQEFYGDEPGNEKLVVIASAKAIDVSARYFTEAGKFLRATPEAASAAFADKSIRLGDLSPQAQSEDPAQKILQVKIVQ